MSQLWYTKKSDAERKKLKQKIQRECRDHINSQFKENDAISVLAEGQSIVSYKRMRMSQSFETPEQKRERAKNARSAPRKHSPNFDQVQWDKEGLLQRLRDWPEGEIVNWTQLATEFNIPGSNRGQTAKEFAAENSVDTSQLRGGSRGGSMGSNEPPFLISCLVLSLYSSVLHRTPHAFS